MNNERARALYADCTDFTEDSNQRAKAFIVISESVKEILNSIWLIF